MRDLFQLMRLSALYDLLEPNVSSPGRCSLVGSISADERTYEPSNLNRALQNFVPDTNIQKSETTTRFSQALGTKRYFRIIFCNARSQRAGSVK